MDLHIHNVKFKRLNSHMSNKSIHMIKIQKFETVKFDKFSVRARWRLYKLYSAHEKPTALQRPMKQ